MACQARIIAGEVKFIEVALLVVKMLLRLCIFELQFHVRNWAQKFFIYVAYVIFFSLIYFPFIFYLLLFSVVL
jgi:hypothetical protein